MAELSLYRYTCTPWICNSRGGAHRSDVPYRRERGEDDIRLRRFAALSPLIALRGSTSFEPINNAIHLVTISISRLFLCALWLRCACSAPYRWHPFQRPSACHS